MTLISAPPHTAHTKHNSPTAHFRTHTQHTHNTTLTSKKMDAWQTFKRKREMRKARRSAGIQAGRGGRKAPGGRMVVGPKEPAAVHQLMADDARPNLRVWQMWDEACDFEGELSHFRDNLSKFENATDEFLRRIEPIMRAPLPRVWDAVDGGLAEPTRATISHGHQHTVGGDASIAGMEEARSEFHNRLRGHVIRPLHQWSEALGVVQERLPELKRLRQEVIKASRSAAKSGRQYKSRAGQEEEGRLGPDGTAASGTGRDQQGAIIPYRGNGGIGSMFGACGRPKVGGGSGGVSRRAARRQRKHETSIEDDYYSSSSGSDDDADYANRESGVDRATRREIEMEEAGMRLNYKHRELQAARADYAESERLIADQLAGLQRDAAWTKSYMISSLLLTKECMQTAVVSLGNTKQPLPGFQGRSASLLQQQASGSRHGELRDNVELAAAMPEDISAGLFEAHMRAGLPATSFGGRQQGAMAALPPAVHAHKATAAPMELHARPDVADLDRVHTAPTGAGVIPSTALQGLSRGGGDMTGVEATSGYRPGEDQSEVVCGRKTFTQIEDRPVVRERVETIVEHRPVEKQFVTELRYEGERPLPGSAEHVDTQTRVVATTPPGPTCPSGLTGQQSAIAAGGVAGGAVATHTSRRHRRQQRGSGSRSSSSSSSSSSSGDEREGGRGIRGGVSAGDVALPLATQPVAAGAGYAGVQSVLREDQSEVVCGRKTFSQVEDRPVLSERVETVVEHRPVEKQFVTELRYEGERALPGSAEHVDTQTRVVDVAAPGPKCPNGVCEATSATAAGGASAATGLAPAGVDAADMAGGFRGSERVAAV